MNDILVALTFVAIFLAPCVVATQCASDCRPLPAGDDEDCLEVERRDSR